MDWILSVVFGLAGVWLLAVSVEGYFLIKFPVWLRPFFFVAAVLFIGPAVVKTSIGAALAAIGFAVILIIKARGKSGEAGTPPTPAVAL